MSEEHDRQPRLRAAAPPALSTDESLPGLSLLFEGDWVWQAYCQEFGPPDELPEHLRVTQFQYQKGSRALVSYVAERRWGRWVVEDQFAIELLPGQPARLFRFPDDPYLPGLRHVASALEAHQLLPKYVQIHPQRLRIETVRYRPANRAVLRYLIGFTPRRAGLVRDVTLFVRVMPPGRLPRLMTAAELAERSGFFLPRLAGHWQEGGVVWLAYVPGATVRALLREGTPPEPEQLLDCLAPLWESPVPDGGPGPDVPTAFRWTERVIAEALGDGELRPLLQRVAEGLRPFATSWRPTALAHNDFYDDQVILTPEGRLALVDFEETGPGDPLLDIGNLLAHLSWMQRVGIAPEACEAYRRETRAAALRRFGWEPDELALREAYALFRLSSNPVRSLERDWPRYVETGLGLAAERLASAS